jgi:hypothetical protein
MPFLIRIDPLPPSSMSKKKFIAYQPQWLKHWQTWWILPATYDCGGSCDVSQEGSSLFNIGFIESYTIYQLVWRPMRVYVQLNMARSSFHSNTSKLTLPMACAHLALSSLSVSAILIGTRPASGRTCQHSSPDLRLMDDIIASSMRATRWRHDRYSSHGWYVSGAYRIKKTMKPHFQPKDVNDMRSTWSFHQRSGKFTHL